MRNEQNGLTVVNIFGLVYDLTYQAKPEVSRNMIKICVMNRMV